MSDIIEIKLPDIGGSKDVNVAEIYFKVGDYISKDDNLMMLETDKATMEVPVEYSGTIKELPVSVNTKINEGDLILKLEVADNIKSAEVNNTKKDINDLKQEEFNNNVDEHLVKKQETKQIDNRQPVDFSKVFASPSIRKLAREMQVDLNKISGTGAKNRITEKDVKEALNNNKTSSNNVDLLPWPEVDFTQFGEIEVTQLSRIKKISGANLLRNWMMIPHVTQFDQADITELEEFRKKLNIEYKDKAIKVTPLAFLIKACVYALKKFPELNSSLDKDNIIYKKYYNVGFAADTKQGLVVPVLKDADKKGIIQITEEIAALALSAREGKLKPSDMQGGTFTISSLGGIGGEAFTPIINAPEVAILGVSKSSIKPIYNGQEFLPRLMLPLSLSYDHRIIDGAMGAKFTSYLIHILSDIKRLIL